MSHFGARGVHFDVCVQCFTVITLYNSPTTYHYIFTDCTQYIDLLEVF